MKNICTILFDFGGKATKLLKFKLNHLKDNFWHTLTSNWLPFQTVTIILPSKNKNWKVKHKLYLIVNDKIIHVIIKFKPNIKEFGKKT